MELVTMTYGREKKNVDGLEVHIERPRRMQAISLSGRGESPGKESTKAQWAWAELKRFLTQNPPHRIDRNGGAHQVEPFLYPHFVRVQRR